MHFAATGDMPFPLSASLASALGLEPAMSSSVMAHGQPPPGPEPGKEEEAHCKVMCKVALADLQDESHAIAAFKQQLGIHIKEAQS